MDLAKEISFLLYEHDCVIVPNFGAFIKQHKPAENNELALYSKPVSDTITFNNQITNNDGLLANRLTITKGFTFNEAVNYTNSFVEDFWTILNTKGNAELEGVGTFYFTQEEKLIFIPHHALNFCKASYGLPKIKLSKLSTQRVEEKTVERVIIPIPETSLETLPQEVDTPVLVQQKLENKRKYEELQAKRLAKKHENLKTEKKVQKWSGLSIVNTLGSLVLIAMVVGLFLFEKNLENNQKTQDQIASMLNTSSFSDDNNPESSNPAIIADDIPTYKIYALNQSDEQAQLLYDNLKPKYKQAQIADDGSNDVFIIAFDDEELALEYKKLIQNKLDQKLVIK